MKALSGLSRILVATDISDPGRHVLDRASLIPLKANETHIKVVAVLPSLSQFKSGHAAQAAAAHRLLEDEEYLTKITRNNPKVRIESELLVGHAAEEIVKAAEKGEFDLIVMGAQSKGRTSFFGSTAEKVAHSSPIPTLLVSNKPSHAYARPLFAASDKASKTLAELISKMVDPKQTPLIVLHAWHIPFEGMLELAGESALLLNQDREGMQVEAQDLLDAHVSNLKERFSKVEPALREGDAAQAILNEVRSAKVDLVIMRPNDRPVWLNSLMGSVARAVIASANCDVLLVKHEKR